jgi:hypothetical protein
MSWDHVNLDALVTGICYLCVFAAGWWFRGIHSGIAKDEKSVSPYPKELRQTEIEELESDLQHAIDHEDYEKAAKLRDKLKRHKKQLL